MNILPEKPAAWHGFSGCLSALVCFEIAQGSVMPSAVNEGYKTQAVDRKKYIADYQGDELGCHVKTAKGKVIAVSSGQTCSSNL